MSNSRPRRPARQAVHLFRVLAILLPAALSLAACSTVTDMMPHAVGGLPEDAPPRPAQQPQYQPVNAAPVPRDTPPLTVEEQKKLESELVAVRDRQAASTAAIISGEPAKATPVAATPANKDKKSAAKPGEKKKPARELSNASSD